MLPQANLFLSLWLREACLSRLKLGVSVSNLTATGALANARTGHNRLGQTIRAWREQDASKRILVRSLASVSFASTFVATS